MSSGRHSLWHSIEVMIDQRFPYDNFFLINFDDFANVHFILKSF